MALRQLFVSDISGEEIRNGEHATVSVTYDETQYTVDARFEEVQHLIANARKSKKRGRKANKAHAQV